MTGSSVPTGAPPRPPSALGLARLPRLGVLFWAPVPDGVGPPVRSPPPAHQARRPDIIVAYEMDGRPLTNAHGGPARLYVAPMYGYKSCKWLGEITLTDEVVPGFWEQRGYDVDGWVGRSNGRDDRPT